MRFEVETLIPNGHTPTGEFRVPRSGDLFLHQDKVKVCTRTSSDPIGKRVILRKNLSDSLEVCRLVTRGEYLTGSQSQKITELARRALQTAGVNCR